MKKWKKLTAVLLTVVMAASLAACGGSSDSSTGDSASSESKSSGGELIFTTGGDQGTYYGFGSVLAGQISDLTDTTVTAIVGKGSKANIEAMDAGDAQLGFVQSDVMSYAYNGTSYCRYCL